MTDAITSRVYGPALGGGVAGERNVLHIQARDCVGNDVGTGGDAFTVDIRGPEYVEAEVRDHGDGTYTAEWTLEIKGHYVVSVYLKDIPVAGSPFPEALWTSGPVYGPKCTVEGSGIFGTQVDGGCREVHRKRRDTGVLTDSRGGRIYQDCIIQC